MLLLRQGTLPEKGQLYGSIEATIQQFELVMHNRALMPPGEPMAPSKAPTVNSATTSWGMATAPVAVSVRPLASSTSRLAVLEGHQLADFVAVLGSLNIIAAELDR